MTCILGPNELSCARQRVVFKSTAWACSTSKTMSNEGHLIGTNPCTQYLKLAACDEPVDLLGGSRGRLKAIWKPPLPLCVLHQMQLKRSQLLFCLHLVQLRNKGERCWDQKRACCHIGPTEVGESRKQPRSWELPGLICQF